MAPRVKGRGVEPRSKAARPQPGSPPGTGSTSPAPSTAEAGFVLSPCHSPLTLKLMHVVPPGEDSTWPSDGGMLATNFSVSLRATRTRHRTMSRPAEGRGTQIMPEMHRRLASGEAPGTRGGRAGRGAEPSPRQACRRAAGCGQQGCSWGDPGPTLRACAVTSTLGQGSSPGRGGQPGRGTPGPRCTAHDRRDQGFPGHVLGPATEEPSGGTARPAGDHRLLGYGDAHQAATTRWCWVRRFRVKGLSL